MSSHGPTSGDHSSLKGLDAALLQSQLVCLGYICLSCCITMYRGTVRGVTARWPRHPRDTAPFGARSCSSPFLCSTAPCQWSPLAHPPLLHPPPLAQAWHNDGWHLPMVIALAFSTYLKLKQVSGEDHSA
jgi:hypothetical protein